MKNILEGTVEEIVSERAEWIDYTIQKAVPEWKLKILLKFNHKILRKLLRADIEIIYKQLIGNFGMKTIIKLNGQIIGERMFK